jgi:hypothetical protein
MTDLNGLLDTFKNAKNKERDTALDALMVAMVSACQYRDTELTAAQQHIAELNARLRRIKRP